MSYTQRLHDSSVTGWDDEIEAATMYPGNADGIQATLWCYRTLTVRGYAEQDSHV